MSVIHAEPSDTDGSHGATEVVGPASPRSLQSEGSGGAISSELRTVVIMSIYYHIVTKIATRRWRSTR